MPKMSMTMETGELINFHVKVGDQVKSGDVLFEVMTDKIDMEVEAPADGVIDSLVAEPGSVVEIGKPVLIMLTEIEVMAFDFGDDEQSTAALEIPAPTPVIETPVAAPAPIIVNANVKAVPKARIQAANRGIDLRTVYPTGPDRTVTMQDVNGARLDPALIKRQEANKALIAKGIQMSRTIAQASFNRRVTANFDHASFIAAWAKVLRARPDIIAHEYIGVALIIESKYGSALPVFRDPDFSNLTDLRTLIASTVDAAKNGKVPVAMLSGATTTVFDLTTYSMSSASPFLFPNQVTSVTIGYDSETTKNISLTIDLNFCDFYDGALLLDALFALL
jgi:pyruvate dehydrogenase E2 component (dihydrolipoamide acetyltransferase)